MIGAAVVFLVWTVGAAVVAKTVLDEPRRRLRRRVAEITRAHAVEHTGEVDSSTKRRLIQGRIKELEKRRASGDGETTTRLLQQSGLDLSLRGFVGVCVLVGAVAAALAALAGAAPGAALVVGAGTSVWLPRKIVRIFAIRRRKVFVAHFADALDILVRGTRSGLPVGECMRIVGSESPDPVGPEFERLVEGQRMGLTLKQGLERFQERMPIPEVQFFAVVLLVQQQTGGNLASTLENLSRVLRERKRLKDKVSALSSEAKASAAIIGALPFVVGTVLTVVNPNYMGLLFSEPIGNVMIAGGLLWMTIGVFVMHGMINFDT